MASNPAQHSAHAGALELLETIKTAKNGPNLHVAGEVNCMDVWKVRTFRIPSFLGHSAEQTHVIGYMMPGRLSSRAPPLCIRAPISSCHL